MRGLCMPSLPNTPSLQCLTGRKDTSSWLVVLILGQRQFSPLPYNEYDTQTKERIFVEYNPAFDMNKYHAVVCVPCKQESIQIKQYY